MAFLNKLERIFGRFAIPSLALVLIVGQVLAWFAIYRHVLSPYTFVLLPEEVGTPGGWWHLFSFLLLPPRIAIGSMDIIFMVFTWWMIYMMGTALEGFWGTFRFNLFLLCGYIFTVGAGFIYPANLVTNLFFEYSIFLAFAYLNPDFEVMIFYVIPVKIKWLAALAWVFFLFEVVTGPGPVRVQAAAITANFLLFFGNDLYLTLRLRGRQVSQKTVKVARPVDAVRHRCRVCGKTDVSDPQMDFRYCSKCVGDPCYCSDHIFNHPHVTVEAEPPKAP